MSGSDIVIVVASVGVIFLYVRNIILLFTAGQVGESILRAIGILVPIVGVFLGFFPNRKA